MQTSKSANAGQRTTQAERARQKNEKGMMEAACPQAVSASLANPDGAEGTPPPSTPFSKEPLMPARLAQQDNENIQHPLIRSFPLKADRTIRHRRTCIQAQPSPRISGERAESTAFRQQTDRVRGDLGTPATIVMHSAAIFWGGSPGMAIHEGCLRPTRAFQLRCIFSSACVDGCTILAKPSELA